MWHFECIEFGPTKPKYLVSHLTKSQRESWAYHVRLIRFDHRISSWLALAVNGTKAFHKQLVICSSFDGMLEDIPSTDESASHYLNDLVELTVSAHTC